MNQQNRKRTPGRQTRRLYLTALAGLLSIAALIYAGIAVNEEPDLQVKPTPTQMAYQEPTKQVTENEPTMTQEAMKPTALPTKEADITKKPEATQAGKKPDEEKKLPTGKPTAKPTDKPKSGEEITGKDDETEPVSAEALAALSYETERGLNWPVLGEITLRYSMDHGVYHKTLNSFRTNDGVMIAAKPGTNVVSAAEGIITAVSEDTMRGNCVVMAIGSGYEITYGQLQDIACKVGDKLLEGERIGTVSEPTKYYSLEGSHLYLKVRKDGETVNPMLLLRTRE